VAAAAASAAAVVYWREQRAIRSFGKPQRRFLRVAQQLVDAKKRRSQLVPRGRLYFSLYLKCYMPCSRAPPSIEMGVIVLSRGPCSLQRIIQMLIPGNHSPAYATDELILADKTQISNIYDIRKLHRWT
jgi:hypothetical protein